VNVYDVVNADTIIMSKKALEIVTTWLNPASVKASSSKEAK
jgi:hypothetical protein